MRKIQSNTSGRLEEVPMTAFPYPLTAMPIHDLVRVKETYDSFSQLHYDRRRSTDAIIFKAQYLELDRRLLEVFSHVAPAKSNCSTYSVTFATLIKNAANLFELGSRWLYPQIFDSGGGDLNLNIFHYLSLDKFTKASSVELKSFQFYDKFASHQIYKPFCTLEGWDQESPLATNHVPVWWTASNKLKHTNSGLQNHGTLENAIAAVGASFAFLHAVFGPGLVYGLDIDGQGVIHNEATSSVFSAVL
jgi:hypothetical protein